LAVAKLRVKTAVPFSERPRIAAASARSTIRCNPSLRSYNRLDERHAGRPVRTSVRGRAASKFARVLHRVRYVTRPRRAWQPVKFAGELTFFFLRRDKKERTEETERKRERGKDIHVLFASQQRVASRRERIRGRFISRTVRHTARNSLVIRKENTIIRFARLVSHCLSLSLVRLANGDGCYTPMRVFLTETRNILSIEAQQNFVGATPAALFHYPITVHARDSVSRCVHYTVIDEMSSNRQRACRVSWESQSRSSAIHGLEIAARNTGRALWTNLKRRDGLLARILIEI